MTNSKTSQRGFLGFVCLFVLLLLFGVYCFCLFVCFCRPGLYIIGNTFTSRTMASPWRPSERATYGYYSPKPRMREQLITVIVERQGSQGDSQEGSQYSDSGQPLSPAHPTLCRTRSHVVHLPADDFADHNHYVQVSMWLHLWLTTITMCWSVCGFICG